MEEARAATNTIRQETAVQKQKLDQRLKELRAAQAHLKALERQAEAALRAERAQYARMAADEKRMRRTLAATAAAKQQLQHKINRLVARQYHQGNIPSQYNGTLRWPMGGVVTQDFGCTGVVYEPPMGNCAHWHNGIDIVAPYGTPVHASGAGRVVYVGWNYADGADPAWIVIIAHSQGLSTWYAHMQSRYKVRAGQRVSQGPGHRQRGQHRPFDRRPPPLDGRAQRELREPQAVHVADAGRRAQEGRRSPARC